MQKNKKRVSVALLLLSLVGVFYILFTGSLWQVSLLPLAFGLFSFFFLPKNLVLGSGFVMMLLVCSLRYILYPILFVAESSDSFVLSPYLNRALAYMLFELCVIFITINVFCHRNKVQIQMDQLKLSKISPFFPFLLLLYVLLIYALFPTVFANRHFVFNSADITAEKVTIPGSLTAPIKWAEILILVYFFSICYFKYKKSKRKIYYYASILVILFPCMFFSGHSRLSLLMPMVCSVFMLIKIYKDSAKRIVSFIIVYGICALSVLSLYKFYGDASANSLSANFTLDENASLLNAYFGGIQNVIVGLQAYDLHGSNVEVFINDTFRNAMGISKYFDSEMNSVSLFNSSFYGRGVDGDDQICPTIIEGLLWFGPYLCFVPTVIMIVSILIFDYKWYTTESLEYSYLYANIASLIGWCIPGNYMHLSSSCFNLLLPVSLLIIVNRMFLARKKRINYG